MKQKLGLALLTLVAVLLLIFFARNGHFVVLNPKGWVAHQERNLIFTALGLMLIVVIPVLAMTLGIAIKYRASNKKATYMPDWEHSRLAETIWWGLPCAIIILLALVTWHSSHALDPFKPLASEQKPLTIQVVALQWKWLFIYPEEQVATVNFVQFPANRPVNFVITADAPMNSFWIPELGGQIYAMAGMSTQLHLVADAPGSFRGVSANLSGEGFANMHFTANAVSASEFADWTAKLQTSESYLNLSTYNWLANPSEMGLATYVTPSTNLYDEIVNKYMTTPMYAHHTHTQ